MPPRHPIYPNPHQNRQLETQLQPVPPVYFQSAEVPRSFYATQSEDDLRVLAEGHEALNAKLATDLDAERQKADVLEAENIRLRAENIGLAGEVAERDETIGRLTRKSEGQKQDNADLVTEVIRLGRKEDRLLEVEADRDDLEDEVMRLAPLEDKYEDALTDVEIAYGYNRKQANVIVEQNKAIEEWKIKARIDEKTGLPRAGTFWDMVEADLAGQKREATKGERGGEQQNALLIFDIDNFKKINDALLHAGADLEVLIPTAKTLMDNIRAGDFICRWGGEEIGVYLKNVTPAEAIRIAEKLKELVNEIEMSQNIAGRDTVGISVGVAALWSGGSVEEAFVRADAALLVAKKAPDKNSTVHYKDIDVEDEESIKLIEESRAQIRKLREKEPSGRETVAA